MTRHALSARDPAGSLVEYEGRLLRFVLPDGEANAKAVLASPTIAKWQQDGRFVESRVLPREQWPALPEADRATMVLEHPRVWFASYPSEWTPGMLADAGALTSALARELLAEGLGLKDATPLNVLFDGCRPVFIDALSVEPRRPDDAVWFAYGQFIRTFVLPLLAARHLGWSMRRTFTGARDGVSPEELFALMSAWTLARPTVFSAVTGPVLLSKLIPTAASAKLAASAIDPARARFAVEGIVRSAGRLIERARVQPSASKWTSYRDPSLHPQAYHERRKEIVEQALQAVRPQRVLDIGTNDGAFALLAARLGAAVVAIDRDEAVVEQAYEKAKQAKANVLPLVVDLLDPTPATGWRNEERRSFLDRAQQGFDSVLCLAVLHHMVVGDWLPLDAVFEQLSELTRDLMLVEFVPIDDPQCAQLLRGRPISAAQWSVGAFVAVAERRFDIERRVVVSDSGRELFVLRRRQRDARA